MADDDTRPMRRTIDAGFDRAYQRALTRREQRRQRVDAEVARHLDEVAREWRLRIDHLPVRLQPDAGRDELARGIGTAIVIVCAAVVLAVFAIAMGLAP